ncbi:cytidine deaminase [Paenibacillus caui]|uniref:cytidine deaminase n=1 Tax=Paenibacillus caui TaxID=2873927 RepID=UPI001CA982EF|nr:cytidine deaminase [Paenibacillus caui]
MDYKALLQEAMNAYRNAYVPYSKFSVGAALLDDKGVVHHGCNVENAAYGPTNCAERTAVFRAIADGCRPGSFKAIAVVGDTDDPIVPCGVCRQVLAELCGLDMPIILGNLKGEMRETTMRELLPFAFVPSHLDEARSHDGRGKP